MEIKALHQLFLKSSGICTDTRQIVPNTIFFALKGANFNGNQFADQALKENVNFVVVDDPTVVKSDRFILVKDTLKTLQDLGNYHRKQFNLPVIGITGSNGKTTSKELIGSVLSQKYNVLMTQGNLNNHLGVPFTLLKLDETHEIAIIEMGANKPGDIKELAEIAEPTHGIITNIGKAHIEGFGSLQGVINTKTELYNFVEYTQGQIFYNTDDAILNKELPANIECIGYGKSVGKISGKLKALTPFVELAWQKENYESPVISTQLVGKYNFTNFLAAICIGNYFDVEPIAINYALTNYAPSNNRSQVTKTERNTLIVDCYNANPSSMASALESFFEIDAKHKLVILGDMLELGNISESEHKNIAAILAQKSTEVILVGHEFKNIGSDFQTYLTVQELTSHIDLSQVRDTLILLKGSRGIKLEALIEKL